MGCNTGKMVKVEPQPMKDAELDIRAQDSITSMDCGDERKRTTSDQRAVSAHSKISKRSGDSAFVDGDTDSLISLGQSTRASSGM